MKAAPTGRSSKALPRNFLKWRRKSWALKPTSFKCQSCTTHRAELAQPVVQDWKKGECDLIPGKTAPNYVAVERDYPNLYKKFTAVGPLLEKLGNGGKGINVEAAHEVDLLRDLNGTVREEGVSKDQPKLETAIDAAEMAADACTRDQR